MMSNDVFFSLFEFSKRMNTLAEEMQKGFECLRKAVLALPDIKETLKKVTVFAAIELPQHIKDAGITWASYGWVPFLPESTMREMFAMIKTADNQEEADSIMLNKINELSIDVLFSKIEEYVLENGSNIVTWEDAIKSFNFEAYTACLAMIYALIDSIFISGQSPDNGRRKLSRKAVKCVYDNNKGHYYVNAVSTHSLIEKIFQDAEDFQIEETCANRNFLGHGMNKYNPNRTDCLKGFVLLYNIYFLFDIGLFSWDKGEKENDISCNERKAL